MSTTAIDTKAIWAALQLVQDPELGFSITDLGLVYAVEVTTPHQLTITMTLTSPLCPLQAHFQQAIGAAIEPLLNQTPWQLEFTFTPPWSLALAQPAVQEHFALLGIPLSR